MDASGEMARVGGGEPPRKLDPPRTLDSRLLRTLIVSAALSDRIRLMLVLLACRPVDPGRGAGLSLAIRSSACSNG